MLWSERERESSSSSGSLSRQRGQQPAVCTRTPYSAHCCSLSREEGFKGGERMSGLRQKLFAPALERFLKGTHKYDKENSVAVGTSGSR